MCSRAVPFDQSHILILDIYRPDNDKNHKNIFNSVNLGQLKYFQPGIVYLELNVLTDA